MRNNLTKALKTVAEYLAENSEPLESEIVQMVDDNFWDLVKSEDSMDDSENPGKPVEGEG